MPCRKVAPRKSTHTSEAFLVQSPLYGQTNAALSSRVDPCRLRSAEGDTCVRPGTRRCLPLISASRRFGAGRNDEVWSLFACTQTDTESKQASKHLPPPQKKKKETNLQYNISMLNIGQAARRPEGPSMLAAFINLIINNLHSTL